MNKILYIINGVLLLAVVCLFYQVQTLKNNCNILPTDTVNGNDSNKQIINSDLNIAFVNTDSINKKYNYIVEFTKAIKSKKANLDAQLQNMVAKFQKDYEAYQRSAQLGIVPKTELMRTEETLKKLQQDIANKELQLQNLVAELEEKNMALNQNVKIFVKEMAQHTHHLILAYSDLNPSILLIDPKRDITNQVINGLNEAYEQSKSK